MLDCLPVWCFDSLKNIFQRLASTNIFGGGEEHEEYLKSSKDLKDSAEAVAKAAADTSKILVVDMVLIVAVKNNGGSEETSAVVKYEDSVVFRRLEEHGRKKKKQKSKRMKANTEVLHRKEQGRSSRWMATIVYQGGCGVAGRKDGAYGWTRITRNLVLATWPPQPSFSHEAGFAGTRTGRVSVFSDFQIIHHSRIHVCRRFLSLQHNSGTGLTYPEKSSIAICRC